jgi:hypothetical protein
VLCTAPLPAAALLVDAARFAFFPVGNISFVEVGSFCVRFRPLELQLMKACI